MRNLRRVASSSDVRPIIQTTRIVQSSRKPDQIFWPRVERNFNPNFTMTDIEYRIGMVEKVTAGEMSLEEAQRLARENAPLPEPVYYEICGNH